MNTLLVLAILCIPIVGIFAFYMGRYSRSVDTRIDELITYANNQREAEEKPAPVEGEEGYKSPSTLVDFEDPLYVQKSLQQQHDEMMRKLNK